jgi:hypothetical protein
VAPSAVSLMMVISRKRARIMNQGENDVYKKSMHVDKGWIKD